MRMKTPAVDGRLVSLDQFRGYTVIGMLLVNFLGGFRVCPELLRHSNDHLSYADTIMPQFLFAVGFAMRLSISRKLRQEGVQAVRLRMAKRLFGLVLISLVIYSVAPPASSWSELREMGLWDALQEPLKRSWFQTLMHIAITSIWILPVIQARAAVRVLWLVMAAIMHVLLSAWFNFEWVHASPRAIDGGPLGFLTWSIPALVGSFACDIFLHRRSDEQPASAALSSSLSLALMLMMIGYGLSCGTRLYDVTPTVDSKSKITNLAASPVWPTPEQWTAKMASSQSLASFLAEPPFISPPPANQRQWNYWMMSQRAGTLSYLIFAAGFSLAVFALFYVCCDIYGLQLGFLRLFGINALLAYVLHDLVATAIKPFAPSDSPWWYVALALALFFAITSLFVRHFDKNGIYLRV